MEGVGFERSLGGVCGLNMAGLSRIGFRGGDWLVVDFSLFDIY